ncbi:hypothetical protein AB4172_16510 [Vibrio splendidus]|jgi:hypothetical protein
MNVEAKNIKTPSTFLGASDKNPLFERAEALFKSNWAMANINKESGNNPSDVDIIAVLLERIIGDSSEVVSQFYGHVLDPLKSSSDVKASDNKLFGYVAQDALAELKVTTGIEFDPHWSTTLSDGGNYLLDSPFNISINNEPSPDMPEADNDHTLGTITYHVSDELKYNLPYSTIKFVSPITVYRENIHVVLGSMGQYLKYNIEGATGTVGPAISDVKTGISQTTQCIADVKQLMTYPTVFAPSNVGLSEDCLTGLDDLSNNLDTLNDCLIEYKNLLPRYFDLCSVLLRWSTSVDAIPCSSLGLSGLNSLQISTVSSNNLSVIGNIISGLGSPIGQSGMMGYIFHGKGFSTGFGKISGGMAIVGGLLALTGAILKIVGEVQLEDRINSDLTHLKKSINDANTDVTQAISDVSNSLDQLSRFKKQVQQLVADIKGIKVSDNLNMGVLESNLQSFADLNMVYLCGEYAFTMCIEGFKDSEVGQPLSPSNLNLAAQTAINQLKLFLSYTSPTPKTFKQTLTVGYLIREQQYGALKSWAIQQEISLDKIKQLIIYAALLNSSSPEAAHEKINEIIDVTQQEIKNSLSQNTETLIFSGGCQQQVSEISALSR